MKSVIDLVKTTLGNPQNWLPFMCVQPEEWTYITPSLIMLDVVVLNNVVWYIVLTEVEYLLSIVVSPTHHTASIETKPL